jgi:beta-glucosidase
MPFKKFPSHFLWGTATSSFQIEGAAKEDGKGESIWDRYSHTPGRVLNDDNGDVACDHYHLWEEDLRLVKQSGSNTYRFSLSWPRIMPEGTGRVNQKGLDFYSRIIDRLLEYGIQPNVTLNHWDLPQVLQDRGGWAVRDSVEWFGDYAEQVFKQLGDRVPFWSTHNEPWVIAMLGYYFGNMAPGMTELSKAIQSVHHLLVSHANAVQRFRMLACPGKIGIVLNVSHNTTNTSQPEDLAARKRAYDFLNGLFLRPLYHGEYPKELMQWLDPIAPVIEAGDMAVIKGSADFLGLNYYMTHSARYDPDGGVLKMMQDHVSNSYWGRTDMGWGVNPVGLYELLKDVQLNYGNPDVYITENGMAAKDLPDEQGFVVDRGRIMYLRDHLLAMHDAIETGANVKGYYAWSLLDNFEWAKGYTPRFGLVRVDFKSLKRIPKESFHWYSEVTKNNGLWE